MLSLLSTSGCLVPKYPQCVHCDARKIKLWKCNNKITVVVRAVALKCERNYISVEWLHKQISINALTNSLLSQEKWEVSIDYPGDAPQTCRNEREWEQERELKRKWDQERERERQKGCVENKSQNLFRRSTRL